MPDYLPEDQDLDQQLRGVPLPTGFLARLREIGELSDAEVDRALKDVPLPAGLLHRLRGIPRTMQLPLHRYAMAAGILIIVGLGSATIGGLLVSAYRNNDGPAPHVARNPVDQPRPGSAMPDVRIDVPPVNDKGPAFVQHPLDPPETFDPRPFDEAIRNFEFPKPSPDVLQPGDVFASPATKLPSLALVSPLKPRGVTPSRAEGYDLAFQLAHGVHPAVLPSAHPSLATSHVPLVTDTASYDLVRQAIDRGQLPAANRVFLEEILAAMDYRFPPPSKREVAIRTAAGPGPLSAPGATMLQVAVQAGSLRADQKQMADLTIVLDVSSSMRIDGHLELAQRAVADYAAHLDDHDRLSLVVFNDKASVLVEGVNSLDPSRLVAALEKLKAAGEANLGAGLRLAVETATKSPAKASQRRIVLLTDGLSELGREAAAKAETILSDFAAVGGKLQVIDLGEDEPDIESQLMKFAKIGGGDVRSAASVDQVRSALAEVTADSSQVIASNARLKVTFNPAAVASYRLLGHEAVSGGGLLSAPVAADLKAGQAATALYEIVLKPDGEARVATVELSWYEPGTSKQRQLTQPISRLQFAPTFAESPLPLQLAGLAGSFGEILRGSYFTPPNTHSLRKLREAAAGVNPRLRDDPSYRELVDLIERAQRLGTPGSRAVK